MTQATNPASRTRWRPPASGLLWMLVSVLAVFSAQVAHGDLIPFDREVARWVASWRSPSLDGIMRTITFFGSSLWTLLAFGLLGIWVWRRRGRTVPMGYVGAFYLGFVLEMVLRLLVAQWRPDIVSLPESTDWRARFELAGFPSGHAYRSAYVFGWLMSEVRPSRWAAAVRWGSLAMIVLVGFSRLYLNHHWTTDILGSWLLAALTLTLARLWQNSPPRPAEQRQRRGRPWTEPCDMKRQQ